MPLRTVVERDGKDISEDFAPWTEEMLFCFLTASWVESDPKYVEEITGSPYEKHNKGKENGEEYDRYINLMSYCFFGGPYLMPKGDALVKGRQTLTRDWKFILHKEDGSNRPIEFKKGDTFRAWRAAS